MSADDTSIYKHNRSFETALTQLLHSVQLTEGDPQGTYTLPAIDEEQPAYTVEITVAATANERSEQHHDSYCLECDWSVSTAEYPLAEVTRRVVEHATETGHDIESTERTTPTETSNDDSSVHECRAPSPEERQEMM